jgi:streptomycin 6-kinase
VIDVPERLGWWREVPGGAEWLESLPRLVEECARLWSLRVEPPFESGMVSLTMPVTRADGTPVVLKISFPERESELEADALEYLGGEGAVRLIAAERERSALLLERAIPGTSLWEVEDEEATSIAASVLRRLHRRRPPENHPFRVLGDEAEGWMEHLRHDWEALGRPFDEGLVEAAQTAARELAPTQAELVLCHQDFQGSNVLRGEREPWLAIDPKPIVGEPAFDTASLLRDRRWDIRSTTIRRRLDQLRDELGLDRERMRGWGIVHALYWGVGSNKVEPEMVECARILESL